MTAHFITLHGQRVTAVIEVHDDEAPIWRYWGPRLADGAEPGPYLRDTRPLPSFSLDHDQPLSLFPTFGLGWFGQSALLGHRAGRDYAQSPTGCTATWITPGTAIRFDLFDAVAGLEVAITLKLDPDSDVLTLSTGLTNTGDAPFEVQWLASGTVPLPQNTTHIRSWSGRHNHEFIAVEDRLSRSLWRRENRRGLTSHDNFPGAVVAADQAHYGAQLAWSGNHAQCIEWIDDGQYQWQMGEWFAPGEVILAPGESVQTPEMLATCSTLGPNGIAQNFHAAIRAAMDWPDGRMQPRPVHLNTWEGFYFDHDGAALAQLADAAAEIGIERFVLDDGWFHGRHDDTSSLGDWWPDAGKYPDGLLPLASHVTALGMEFGLWVEPEMVNPDSELYRAHPDWALQIAGRPLLTARNQLVLDMARAEVSDYLFDKIADLLATLPIAYLKWDHNRDLVTAGATPRYRQQVQATYALLARLRTAFPQVEIEACAGGGGRIDAGIIRHTHRFWASDCIDAVSRIAIQQGFLQFMPPEIMGSHVGASPAHSTGRSQSMTFRAGVALTGHFGVELDARQIVGQDRETLAQWIALYKQYRDQFHHGKLWQGEAQDGLVWQAHGDADELLLFVYRLTPSGQRHLPTLRLDMLDPNRAYRITRLDPVDPHKHGFPPAPALEAMRGAGLEMAGGWLNAVGLPMPPMKAEQVALFRIVGP
ncbi:alpha-galactosidase [Aquisediminimonas sediminicola]|uniref:alpha-galactosidase n=1 Tax=Alteraquisediminimonas sediminicola TaxID=2676787 RepID=UPI001C8D0724|nr:alpha-galactosidase [Aquisediminimonas sediminicola]